MAALKGYFFPRLIVDETSAQQVSNRSTTSSESGTLSSLPSMRDDAMFQVLVIGTRGAGKTVFLASLFQLLGVQDPRGNNFILSCPDIRSQSQLKNIFEQISSPERGWPPGTTGTQEYIFECEHIKDEQRIKLFRFRYFDFPGGFLGESNENDFAFILTQIRKAHSILVLLDGKKILNLLEDRAPPIGEPSIYDDLSSMGRFLQECIGKPVHFAITKSDILNLKPNSLGKIKKKLMVHTSFRNIIEQRKSRPTYLIPVSAVGNGFAKFDPVTQQMKKLPNGIVEPKHVDMSLTFTLVDYLTKIATQDDSTREKDGIFVRDWLWQNLVVPYAPLAGLLVGPFVDYIFHVWVGKEVEYSIMAISIMAVISAAATLGIRSLLNAGGTKIKELVEGVQMDFANTRRHFAERQAALMSVIKRQIARADRFRAANPDAAFITEESLDR